MIHILAFNVVGKKVHEFSTRGTGVARCIRGKVLPLIPARRVGQGVAAFGLIIRATVDAGLAFVDMNGGGVEALYHGMRELERYTETD